MSERIGGVLLEIFNDASCVVAFPKGYANEA